MNKFMERLEEKTKDLNIKWLASSPQFEIFKTKPRGKRAKMMIYDEFAGKNNKEDG